MRAIVGLIVIVGLVGCGNDETTTVLKKPPLSEIETVYADLKEQFTHHEYRVFIKAIETHCESDPYKSSIQRELKQRLSPEAYSLILTEVGSQKPPHRIPFNTRHKADRIRLVAREHDAYAIFLNRDEKVVYIFGDIEATVFIETDLNPVTELYRLRVDMIHTGFSDLGYTKTQIEELNEAHNGSDKPLPIKLPADIDDLSITVVAFDKDYNPIPPTPEEHHQWIFDYDNAPLATDAQIEHENQRRTPSAFDCIEN